MWPYLVLWRSTMFLLLMGLGNFLRFSCTHCYCLGHKLALNVWFWFKNSKWIMSPWCHHILSITFFSMKLCLWSKLQRFTLVNSLLLCWNKTHFFLSPIMIFLRNGSFLSWKKTYGFLIFIILFNKSMRKPNTQFVHFCYLFQMVANCKLECEVEC